MTEEVSIQAEGQVSASELVSLLQARASFYRVIASLYFKELDEAAIENLKGVDFAAFPFEDESARAGLHDIDSYLKRCGCNVRQDLASDYAGAILGAGTYEDRRATPYESVFTSESGLLMQEARDDVYRFFCEAHLEPEASLQMPEDHLSFMFEFMAALAERQIEALEAGDFATALEQAKVQQSFHASHLANWIDTYCDCLEQVAQTRFYRGLGKLTRGFVREEAEMIADVVAATEELAGR